MSLESIVRHLLATITFCIDDYDFLHETLLALDLFHMEAAEYLQTSGSIYQVFQNHIKPKDLQCLFQLFLFCRGKA